MNATSPHEISQSYYLKFEAYIATKCDPWQKNRILMLKEQFLFESSSGIELFKGSFQSCWIKVVDAPTKVQTKQRPCLTTKYQWVQLGLGQLDIDEDEIRG
jgi:hypothetical protein